MRILFFLGLIFLIGLGLYLIKWYDNYQLEQLRNTLQIKTEEDANEWILKIKKELEIIYNDTNLENKLWSVKLYQLQEKLEKLEHIKQKLKNGN